MGSSGSGDPVYEAAKKLLKDAKAQLPESASLDGEWVHELRVCTKKLRALLQLYRPVASKAALKALDHEIARLAKQFSGPRDGKVMNHLLESFGAANPRVDCAQLQSLSTHLMVTAGLIAENSESKVVVNTADIIESLREIRAQWKTQLRMTQSKGNFSKGLAAGLDYTYSKARKLAYEAEASDVDQHYHECRKWVKYLAYQIKLLVPLKRSRDKAYLKQLEALGSALGEFHDRCLLERHVNQLFAEKSGLSESLEATGLLVLTWAVEQKRTDKQRCQQLFETLFMRPASPVKW